MPQVGAADPPHRDAVGKAPDALTDPCLVGLAAPEKGAGAPLDDRRLAPVEEPVDGYMVEGLGRLELVDGEAGARDLALRHAASRVVMRPPSATPRASSGKLLSRPRSRLTPSSRTTQVAGAKRRASTDMRTGSSVRNRRFKRGRSTTPRSRPRPGAGTPARG